MKSLFPTCCILLFSGISHGQILHYDISPDYSDSIRKIQVSVTFPGTSSGVTYLHYDDNQFGEQGQFDFISLPEQSVDIKMQRDSNRFVVKHDPSAIITAKYTLVGRKENQAFYQYCCYKPIIEPTYFHIQSGHLLLTPENYWASPGDRRIVEIVWLNLLSSIPPQGGKTNSVEKSKDWIVHSSFGASEKQGGLFTKSELMSGVFVGGDFRRYKFEVKGQPIYFLTRSKWVHFTDDTLVQILQRTFQGHRALWNDFSDTLYTVTFLPIDDAPWNDTSKMFSTGGSGLTNSFMSYASNNEGEELSVVRYVYVHELMHRWIGIKIENAAEEKQYWFSEGFTEYFTYKTMLKYGLISVDEWLEGMNKEFMFPHYTSTKRNIPNDSMNYEHFWNGG